MIIGLDEVGRGSIAGPVVVGAFASTGMMPEDESMRSNLELGLGFALADSKKLTPRRRRLVFDSLKDTGSWSVGVASSVEIDSFGINPAITLAASRALDSLLATLPDKPQQIIADAGLFHSYEHQYQTTRHIKADEQFLPVMLASIMAKVWRDNLMTELGTSYPHYAWDRNAGYGTKTHCMAVRKLGLSPEHRRSFCATLGAPKT